MKEAPLTSKEFNSTIHALIAHMDGRFEAVDERFSRIDSKLADHDRQFEIIQERLTSHDQVFDTFAKTETEFRRRIVKLEKRYG